jgi:plastocyanin
MQRQSRLIVWIMTGFMMYLSGCERHEAETSATASNYSTATATPQIPAASADVGVTIDNFTYKPQKITVQAGTRVTWINHDDVPHTVTANDGQFRSGALDSDQKFVHQFDRPGTYPYFCSVHTHMTGTVIVK